MALFGLFNKKDKDQKSEKKGFHLISVRAIEKLTSDTVKVTLSIPDNLLKEFKFIPGQYINLAIDLNGKEERRSYSICSGPGEAISFAVKTVKDGVVSSWLNNELLPELLLFVSKPQGNFTLNDSDKNIVAIAAGSGITPILSIAKALEKNGGHLNLYYGNRTRESIIFRGDLDQLKNTTTKHFLSGETVEGFEACRIDKESFTKEIKENLTLLKADAFFICGPEEMIVDVSKTLEFFGVSKSKIHFELFTTPVLMNAEEVIVTSKFEGESNVKAILDSEAVEFKLHSKGKSILDSVENAGLDAPFSCRGGVCCSCKAKILKGTAIMSMNYSLTDQEIHDGYILTCQAHPSSEELIISYDE